MSPRHWKPLAEGVALVVAAGALIALASHPTASSVLAFGTAVVAYALASFALSDA